MYILFKVFGKIWGADWLHCPHWWMFLWVFPIFCCIFRLKSCVTSSVSVPQLLGYSSVCQFPLAFMVKPVGSSREVIRVAHIQRWCVALAEAPLRDLWSTIWWLSSFLVTILLQHSIVVGPNIYSSMCSLSFEDIIFHRWRISLPVFGWCGGSVIMHHISTWRWWWCWVVSLLSLSVVHLFLAALLHAKLSLYHMYSDTKYSSWFPLMWRKTIAGGLPGSCG